MECFAPPGGRSTPWPRTTMATWVRGRDSWVPLHVGAIGRPPGHVGCPSVRTRWSVVIEGARRHSVHVDRHGMPKQVTRGSVRWTDLLTGTPLRSRSGEHV